MKLTEQDLIIYDVIVILNDRVKYLNKLFESGFADNLHGYRIISRDNLVNIANIVHRLGIPKISPKMMAITKATNHQLNKAWKLFEIYKIMEE